MRRTICDATLTSISENYNTLSSTWNIAKDEARDSENKNWRGCCPEETSISILGKEKILNILDNSSCLFQSPTFSPLEGPMIISATSNIQSLSVLMIAMICSGNTLKTEEVLLKYPPPHYDA